MASSGAIKAGEAFVQIFADKNPLVRGLKSISGELKAWGEGVSKMGKTIGAAGALITAPLIAFAYKAAESGEGIYLMSRRVGETVENLSRMKFAADLTGSSMEGLEVGLKKMQKSIAGVEDATEGTTGSLMHLGLTAEDLKGKRVYEQFDIIAKKIAGIKDPAQRTAATLKVFGRSGTELLPMIERFGELSAMADKLGLVMSGETARASFEFSETIKILNKVLLSVGSTMGRAIMPLLKQKAELFIKAAAAAKTFIKENQGLIISAFKVAAAVVAIGTALYAGGKVLSFFGTQIGVVASLVRVAFAAMILPVQLAMFTITTLGAVLGFILTPFGAVVAILGVCAIAFIDWKNVIGDVGKFASGVFETLMADGEAAFKGIKDALEAGDITAAAKVLWATLKLEWAKGIGFLMTQWVNWKTEFLRVGGAAVGGVELFFNDASANIARIWNNMITDLSNIWQGFNSFFGNAWADTIDAATKVWLGWMVVVGKLTPQQMREAGAASTSDTDRRKRENDARAQENIAKNEARKVENTTLIETSRKARDAKISEGIGATQLGVEEQRLKEIAQLEQDAAMAREDRDVAIWVAAQKKKQAFKEREEKTKKATETNLMNSSSVRGSFNAFSLAVNAGSASTQDRIAKAAEETKKNTKDTRDFLNRIVTAGPLAFT